MVIVILFSAVLLAFAGRRKGRVTLAMGFFVLFLFAALRYMYGNDYASYYRWFLRINSGWKSPFDYEMLYTLLNRICPSFPVLIAVTSLVFICAVYTLVKRNVSSRYAWLSLFIFVVNPYLFLMNLSAIRQCLAMVLFMAAVPFGMERKPVRYTVLILLATMFHKSAFLLFPVYFILQPTQFRKRNVFAVLGMVILLVGFLDWSRITVTIATWFGDPNYVVHASSSVGNSVRATLLTSVYFLYILLNMEKLKGKTLVYAKLSLLGYTLGILAFRIAMMTRVQMYFDIYSIVTLPNILEAVNREGKIRVSLVNPQETVWKCINKYVLPALILAIYLLRIYSFAANPRWRSFITYRTVFDA